MYPSKFTKKNQYLSFSISSSIVSKIANALVTFFSMPLILNRAGVDNFTLYSMVIALNGWLAVFNLSAGPYLMVNISELVDEKNTQKKRVISSSAFYLILVYSLIISFIYFALISFIDMKYIFPLIDSSLFESIYHSLLLLLFFNFFHVILNLFESIQIAYKELHKFNLYVASGSVFVLLTFFLNHHLSLLSIIFISILPIYLARTLNSISFLINHKYLIPSFYFFRMKKAFEIIKASISLSFAGGVANFLSHILPILIMGKVYNSYLTSEFVFLLNIIIGLSGIVSMFILPVLPLLPLYKKNRQFNLIYNLLIKFSVCTFLLGTFVFLLIYGAKGQIINYLKISQNALSNQELIFAYLYFILMSWENIHYNFLLGLNNFMKANKLIFFRALFGIVLLSVLINSEVRGLPFITMCLSIILIDFIPLNVFLNKMLSGKKNAF